jgi:hypothetical protein
MFLMALQPLWALAAFQSPDLLTIGRTPRTSDQFVARALPKHRAAQTQNEHIHTKHPRFESERAKTVHALDRSATVTG